MMLLCNICLLEFPEECFHRAVSVHRNNRQTRCKACQSRLDKLRSHGPYHPNSNQTQKAAARKRRWAKSHRNLKKEKAYRIVKTAVRKGHLIPPSVCSHCNKGAVRSDGVRAIQAHHHKGYDSPLDIVWLCPTCHASADAAIPESANDKTFWKDAVDKAGGTQ